MGAGYFICDERKFTDTTGIKEFHRLKTLCYRLKKEVKDTNYILGLSKIDNHNYGKMGYDMSKRFGGKKHFIAKKRFLDRKTGKLTRNLDVDPHIHIMLYGGGANGGAKKIISYLEKRNPNEAFNIKPLRTRFDVSNYRSYILNQSDNICKIEDKLVR